MNEWLRIKKLDFIAILCHNNVYKAGLLPI